jgi:4-amino-4-deoxy-L-arabinose transferase-like glycosyltransferase
VHPPGVEVYLVLWYQLFGYSIAITRVAMLLLAGAGLLLTFLLAIELSRGTKGAPAFLPPLFLLSAPIFYTQSMMAQLDMPAMALTLLALLFFVQRKYLPAAAASIVLVLVKETGIVAPLIFFLLLAYRKQWKLASLFIAPAIALLAWLAVLHHATGYWLGNPGFAHYNVGYSLNPVRMMLSILRHAYYLFLAEFRWIGTLVLILTWRRCRPLFHSEAWRTALLVAGANALFVSVLGGAQLERYLLPTLPVFYIAIAVGITYLSRRLFETGAVAGLLAGQVFNLFWNPPYPFPYENNYAMVDFVRLQQTAAIFTEEYLPAATIATAWPYTAALRNPDFGFVSHALKTVETNDFHAASILRLPPASFNVLIVYTRTWMPPHGVIAIPFVRRLLKTYYDWEPQISPHQCLSLGLRPTVTWSMGGQEITIYVR